MEPSGFFDTAIGDGAGSIGIVHAISLVFASTTVMTFARPPRLFPTTTNLPSGVTLRSWTPPFIAMVLMFVSVAVSITSTPPVGPALTVGNSDMSSQVSEIAA